MKEVAEETVAECEGHLKSIEEAYAVCDEVKAMIADGFTRLNVEEMSIDELFSLLILNVEIKKKLRLLLEDVDAFSKAINDSRRKYMAKKAASPPQPTYKAARGDAVDEMLANWINKHGCMITITRIGKGFYMFGTKKIYAKIMNGRLVIRVGGGYMSIDEFMKHYGVQEMQRQQRNRLEEDSTDFDAGQALEKEAGKGKKSKFTPYNISGKSVIGVAQAKASLSGRKRAGTVYHKGAKQTSAADLETQLRNFEKKAADGKLKDGFMNINI